jgi:hypothetical protein
MKQGRNLTNLVQELERQLLTKRDFKSPAGRFQMVEQEKGVRFDLNGIGDFGINDTAHEQVGEYLEIPKKYYDRMRAEAPGLLTNNVNSWLAKKRADTRLIRTLDGNVRAILSDRYRPLDNFDLVQAVLPIITNGKGDFVVHSCEVTERRLYIQVVHKELRAVITHNDHKWTDLKDELQAGLVISNSEIGDGSLRIEPMIYRSVCTNAAIVGEAIRKYHVGRGGQGDLDNAVAFYRDETRKADDTAFWMKVQDAVRGAFDEVRFKALVQKLENSTADRIEVQADLPAVVEVVASRYGMSELETKLLSGHFLRNGDFTRYGVLNAMTRTAQDVESYDRAIELERLGGGIVELGKREWEEIAAAKSKA